MRGFRGGHQRWTSEEDSVSAPTVARRKEELSNDFDKCNKNDVSSTSFVSTRADVIYMSDCLGDQGNCRQCILALKGATEDGEKELIAIQDGFRDIEASKLDEAFHGP